MSSKKCCASHCVSWDHVNPGNKGHELITNQELRLSGLPPAWNMAVTYIHVEQRRERSEATL